MWRKVTRKSKALNFGQLLLNLTTGQRRRQTSNQGTLRPDSTLQPFGLWSAQLLLPENWPWPSAAWDATDTNPVSEKWPRKATSKPLIIDVWNLAFSSMGWDSLFGIATRYGLDSSGIESRCWRDYSHPPRPALGPTQPPLKWIACFLPGGKVARAWCSWPHFPILRQGYRNNTATLLTPQGLLQRTSPFLYIFVFHKQEVLYPHAA